jgi:hypothetical protein
MIENSNTNIVVNLRHEIIHKWADCPFEEVAYLRNPHRHILHIKAKKKVSHDDRDIEIIMFKHDLERYLERNIGLNVGNMSCEMIARELFENFNLTYCEVLEDGENGAEIINSKNE